MHVAAVVAGVLLLIAGYVCIFKSLSQTFRLQHEINARLPKDQQFEPVFWSFWTWQRLRQLEKQLLPVGPHPARLRTFRLLGVFLILSGLLLLGLGFGS